MQYPLDSTTVNEFYRHLVAHEIGQLQLISELSSLLESAIDSVDEDQENEEWYKKANRLLENRHRLKIEHENRRFNEDNLRKARGMQKVEVPILPREVHRAVTLPDFNDPEVNSEFNKMEKSFGEEMSETDLVVHFNEKSKNKNKSKKVDLDSKNPFKNMTIEEIEAWEKEQDNSNDIYKIKARVANMARDGGASLTQQGEMLVNTFVHVLDALYQFAETIPDKDIKIQLIKKIRIQEGMPANLVKAAKAGVVK